MIGLAIGLLVYGLGARRATPALAANHANAEAAVPLGQRQAPSESAIAHGLAGISRRLSTSHYEQRLQRRLDRAGNPRNWPVERLLAVKGVGLLLGAAVGVLVGLHHGALVLLLAIVFGAFGLFLPDLLIHNLGEHRQEALSAGLPDALDMLTVCVEAGLGFEAALARVAQDVAGPIGEEFARALQEMQVGLSRVEALRAMAERTAVPEIRIVVSALAHSAELGISIGDVLREQSREMRIRRRQRAEEKAQKLPVKILFPLLLCLLPAMFVVVLGPAVIQVLHTLSSINH